MAEKGTLHPSVQELNEEYPSKDSILELLTKQSLAF